MKILLAQSASYYGLGGAAKANRSLIEGLAARGHDCMVVSIEDKDDLAARGVRLDGAAGEIEFAHGGIRCSAAASDLPQAALVGKRIREFRPDRALVSETGIALLKTALEVDPARVVQIAHSTITDLPTDAGPDIKESVVKLLRQTAGIITVSNYMRRYIREWGGLDSAVIYFPTYGPGPFPHFRNFEQGFVTMVNPCAYKGISIFAGVARSLPDVKFAAVPTWGASAEERAALEQLPNMTMLQPSKNIDDIFAQTRVLLVPSLWGEAFGQIVVEAMLRGIPVLASDAGGLPEAKLGVDYVLPVRMIERYEMDERRRVRPVIPEQNIAPWIDALPRVLSDRALYERLSHESRAAALSFVSKLGPAPFERYLEERAPAANPRAEADGAQKSATPNLHELLNTLSPEKRALLALRVGRNAGRNGRRSAPAPPAAKKENGHRPEAESRGHNSLVRIQPQGHARPFFCVHPVGGNVACYADLARHLGPEQPFYGLQSRALHKELTPDTSVEEMAARYLEEVTGVQPDGPYLIGGWSMGGVVAYEMAQRLLRRGQRVSLLALFDVRVITPEERAAADDEPTLLASFAQDLGLPVQQLAPSLSRLLALSPEERLTYLLEEVQTSGLVSPEVNLQYVSHLYHVFKLNARALKIYIPQPFAGRLTLFRAGEQFSANQQDATMGWGRLAAEGVELHVVPGNHYTMVREPPVKFLAEKLKLSLSKAAQVVTV